MDAAELGRRLRDARAAVGLSQEDAARELGISRPSLTQIENGKRNVTGLELDGLARLYGRPLGDFFREALPADDIQAYFRTNPELAGGDWQPLRDCLLFCRELSQLEQRLDAQSEPGARYGLAAPTSKGQAIRQGNQVAADERRRLALGDGPIDDMAELLESEGVRTALLRLPDNVSGLTLMGGELGRFVAAQHTDAHVRHRFSFAHEYGHVVMDGDGPFRVSRRGDDALIEMRANAFAAAFLMPAEGLRTLVASLGKSRGRMSEIFDGDDAVAAGRATTQPLIALHDAIHVAHRFGVSRKAAIYRMRNIDLVSDRQLSDLLEAERTRGKRLAATLGLVEPEPPRVSAAKRRLIMLGAEAVRRELISHRKYVELLMLDGLTASHEAESLAAELLGDLLDQPHDVLDYD